MVLNYILQKYFKIYILIKCECLTYARLTSFWTEQKHAMKRTLEMGRLRYCALLTINHHTSEVPSWLFVPTLYLPKIFNTDKAVLFQFGTLTGQESCLDWYHLLMHHVLNKTRTNWTWVNLDVRFITKFCAVNVTFWNDQASSNHLLTSLIYPCYMHYHSLERFFGLAPYVCDDSIRGKSKK